MSKCFCCVAVKSKLETKDAHFCHWKKKNVSIHNLKCSVGYLKKFDGITQKMFESKAQNFQEKN